MIYLVAALVPPLYFLIKKKWAAFVVSSLLLFLSLCMLVSIVLIPGAIILWVLCATVAFWDLRKQLMHEHATVIAEKMAAKMQQSPPRSGPPPISHS